MARHLSMTSGAKFGRRPVERLREIAAPQVRPVLFATIKSTLTMFFTWLSR